MDYELYHDESKVDGYWHAILLIPVAKKQALLQLLSQARQNTNYIEPLGIKKIKKYNRIYNCADSWVQIGVAVLMSRTKTEPYPVSLGDNTRGQKHYSLFKIVVGAKFILFKNRDNLKEMTGHLDYGSKVETTFRIGLKGGLHLLGDQSEGIHITRMHFDGHAHYHRHLSRDRIIERLTGLRDYCSISTADDVIDDRTGNHKKAECQEYDDCQILQLTDLLIGCFRTVLTPVTKTSEIHRKLAQPVKEIVDRYQQGSARMWNSRWRNSFCMSQCYLESGSWKFDEIECIKAQEGQQLPMELNDTLAINSYINSKPV